MHAERYDALRALVEHVDLPAVDARRIPLADLIGRPAWMKDASCAERPSVSFFPERGEPSEPTCATVALGAGVPAKVVQEMLGHWPISITLDRYTHVVPGMQRDAAAKIGAVMFG